MSETKILPCPFCGGEAEIRTNFIHHFAICICKECNTVSDYMNSKAEAIAAWNRRTPPAAVPDGWAIVPCEPDDEMTDKGESALIAGPLEKEFKDAPSATWAAAKACYRAMISAAPAAPTDGGNDEHH